MTAYFSIRRISCILTKITREQTDTPLKKHNACGRFIPLFLFPLSLLFIILIVSVPSIKADGIKLIDFSTGWEYSSGDSPRTPDGRFSKALPGDGIWTQVRFPTGPPNRGDARYSWFRIVMPEMELRDPHLFVYSIDTAAEFYLDGRLIYTSGELGAGSRFGGWPWHLIELDTDFGGKLLSVRVYSDYTDIGLWGDLLLGSGKDLIRRLYNLDGLRFAVGVISIIIAGIYSVLFILRPSNRLSLWLAIIALLLCIRVVSNMNIRQWVLDAPLVWEYILLSTSALTPIFIIRSLRVMARDRGLKILTGLMLSYVALFLLDFLLPLSGIIQLHRLYLIHDVFFLVTIAVILVFAVRAIRSDHIELRLLAANYLVMAFLIIYSILIHNAVVPWVGKIDYLIVFVFSAGLCLIITRRFILMYRRERHYSRRLMEKSRQLKAMNTDLEDIVQTRTRQLEEANYHLQTERDKLERVSITDGLTGLYTRVYVLGRFRGMVSEARRYEKNMSIIMIDIDHFKRINDSFGHQVGDRALRIIAEILKDTIRESDVAGRYGGEEFIILLPATDANEAFTVAERIRERTSAVDFTVNGNYGNGPEELCIITLSGGVATFPDDAVSGIPRQPTIPPSFRVTLPDTEPATDPGRVESEQERAVEPGRTAEHDDVRLLEHLINVADSRLYLAKELGRNRIIISSPDEGISSESPAHLQELDDEKP